MATTNKTFLDLAGLQVYDTAIKAWANSVNQVAFKKALTSADGNYLYLYKDPNAVLGDTPDATISLGGGDMAAKIDALADVCGATWNTVTNEYDIVLDSTFDAATDTIVAALNELKGQINVLNGSDTTAGSVAKSIKDAVEGLDVSEFALATNSAGVVTIKGIKEEDGEIAVGTNTANDVTLAKVATTGAAEDVSYSGTIGAAVVTNVDDALDALIAASGSGVAGKTVYITETAGGSGDAFSKRYGIYQGANGSSSSPVVGEKLADIDIPKDMVVESGSVVEIFFDSSDNTLHEGSISGTDVTTDIKGTGTATSADAGKYIKLIIANATSDKVYIKVTDLVDAYTGGTTTEATVAIDGSNVITVTINTIDGTKVTYTTGTGGETVTAALTRLDGNSTVTGSVDNKIANAVSGMSTSTDVPVASYTAGTSGSADVITFTGSVSESNGVVGAGSADDITMSTITDAEIAALFGGVSV